MASERSSVHDGYLIKQDAQVVDRVTTCDRSDQTGESDQAQHPSVEKSKLYLTALQLKSPDERRRFVNWLTVGWCYQHVQAIIVAIDQYAESALGNRNSVAGYCDKTCERL
jgi:hypothetical protein